MTAASLNTVLLVGWSNTRTIPWRRELVGSGDWAALRPAHCLADVRARMAEHPVDLVISDLRLPDGPATDLVRMLRVGHQPRRIPILLVAQVQDSLLLDALQEGADGVFDLTEPNATTLTEHARNVMNGGADIAPWIARRLLEHFGVTKQKIETKPGIESMVNPLELTDAEQHLLRQISIGARLVDVATAIGLAPAECTARVRAIYRKMQWCLRAGNLSLQNP